MVVGVDDDVTADSGGRDVYRVGDGSLENTGGPTWIVRIEWLGVTDVDAQYLHWNKFPALIRTPAMPTRGSCRRRFFDENGECRAVFASTHRYLPNPRCATIG